MWLKYLLISFLLTTAFTANLHAAQKPKKSKIYESEGQKFRFEQLTQRDDVIWSFDFLDDGRILFTERKGALNIFNPKDSRVTKVNGAPEVWANGQGGLLDVRIHPTQRNMIYLTYSEPVRNGATTALGRGTLEGSELKNFKKLFSAHEPNSNKIHFGSRIEFDGQGHLFITVGDRNDRPKVQNLAYHIGSVIRLNEDGSVPEDNPFVKQKNAKPEIWAYGIRSPQGLVRNPQSGVLWLGDMGPRGGDEVNIIERGANYGWPDVTYGREYHGPAIGVPEKEGTKAPIIYWVPSISPSGIALYLGDRFPKWKDDLFLGALSGTHLRRLDLDGTKVVKQESLLEDLDLRVRCVRSAPDGYLYLSTDDGRIARLVPAK